MSILKDLRVPVFRAGGMPAIDISSYLLWVGGLAKEHHRFSWPDILSMPKSRANCRLTSVSGWSVRAEWEGVRWRDFLSQISVNPESRYVRFVSVGGGYSTAVALSDLENPGVLLAYGVNGESLEAEYGWPLRMVIPNLWGYKSCKWLGKIYFLDQEEGGYWEDRGYTRSGVIEPGVTFDINSKTPRTIPGGEVTQF
jgi:DMSO/TMAO reductase YedYZ molybdopterin-dependent catalytic subunit